MARKRGVHHRNAGIGQRAGSLRECRGGDLAFELRARLGRKHGSALDRRRADLRHHLPRLQRGCADEGSVLPEPHHVADDHGAADRTGDLYMAPYQHGVQCRQRLVHPPVERAHLGLGDPRR